MIEWHDHSSLQRQLPFMDKDISSLLVGASTWSGELLGAITEAQLFEARPDREKSIQMKAQAPIDEVPAGINLTNAPLELYFSRDLEVNPNNPRTLRGASVVCELNFRVAPTTSTAFAEALVDAVVDSDCGLKVCGQRDCFEDVFGNFYGCDCDLVIDTNDEDKAFIASVAYRDLIKRIPLDTQLLGLYQPLDQINENATVLGFRLNEPFYPPLEPNFKDVTGLKDRILAFLAQKMRDVGLNITYVPLGESDSRFELHMEFTQSVQLSLGFDGGVDIGGKSAFPSGYYCKSISLTPFLLQTLWPLMLKTPA